MITAILVYHPLPIVHTLGAERSPARFARLRGHWRRTPEGRLTLHWHADPAWRAPESCEPPEEHA